MHVIDAKKQVFLVARHDDRISDIVGNLEQRELYLRARFSCSTPDRAGGARRQRANTQTEILCYCTIRKTETN